MRALVMLVFVAGLGACAGTPVFNTQNVDTTITPQAAVAQHDALRGKKVLWGGMIVNSRNLEKRTQVEVLAYPLDERGRPLADREPLGRFIADYDGYLETVDYAAGRELTLTGSFTGIKEGKIDESVYTYPAITAEQFHLWPKTRDDSEPRFHFGLGVIMRN